MRYNALQAALRSTSIIALSCLLGLCTLTAWAQSGRRVKKSDPLPPVPTPEASPTPTPHPAPERPPIPIFLGANSLDSFGDIPFYFNDSVAKSCAQELGRQKYLSVELSSRDLTRSDAIKRAKEAKEGYVAMLELRSDRMRSSDRNSSLSTVYIEYVVFAAVTGKQITSGSVYQQASGLGDIIGGRSDSTSIAERRLKYAARVTAERILGSIAGP